MRRTFLFLVFGLFCFAAQAQNEDDSLSYLLGEPENVDENASATDEVQLDDITTVYDVEETADEFVPVAPDALPGTIDYKTQKVSVRKFDEKKWESIAGSANYEEKAEPEKKPEEETPEESKQDEQTAPPTQSGPWSGDLLRVISFTLIIIIVLALLYFLLKNTTFETKLRNKSVLEARDLTKPVENIDDLDVQTLLQKTLAQGNLRLAVRLYYLGLLKKLNDVGLIAWKRDKTNRDYLSELFAREEYFDDVRKLTLAYEQVWYGEHAITRESFQVLSTRFETVDQKLNTFKPL